jgi:hypothetical protein
MSSVEFQKKKMGMKKIILLAIASVCFSVASQAQTFAEIDRIESHKDCAVVYAGGMEHPVNAELHAAVLKNPQNFLLMDFEGTGGFIRTLIQKDKISIATVKVDTTAYHPDYDMAVISCSDGSDFLTYDLRWLKVRKGQHIRRSMFDGETKFLVVVSTVERDEPLSEGNPAFPWEWRDGNNKLLSAIVLPGGQIPPLHKEVTVKTEKAKKEVKQTKKEVALAQVTAPVAPTKTQTSTRPALIRN